jgi:hypothetical protein
MHLFRNLNLNNFEERIIVKRLHTLSNMKFQHMVFVIPTHRDNTVRASEYAMEFSPTVTNTDRTASLPKKQRLAPKLGYKVFDL